ncbi:hypothetical protein HYU13_03590 [Candidatus Woesearchaeota archaeon]|nr:hypothetical protein [Candidatus Woesearchaeota archaeon]
MDTSRKIPWEEILLLDEVEVELKKKGIRTTQKELLRKSIRFFIEHKPLWEAGIEKQERQYQRNGKKIPLKRKEV